MNNINKIAIGSKLNLPAMPEVVLYLMNSFGRDDVSLSDVSDLLSKDPALSIKTMRMANSPFYGLSRQISSIPEALHLLGLKTVRTLVTSVGLMNQFQPSSCTGFDFHAFWRHSVGTALFSQALAKKSHMDMEFGFLAGLLHDIGEIAMASSYPQAYADTLAYQKANDVLLSEAERITLHTDHAVVGAEIIEQWRFSPVFVEVVAHHHTAQLHHGPGFVGIVHLADAFACALGLSGSDVVDVVPPVAPEIWKAMGPDKQTCISIFNEVEVQFMGICEAIQI